MTMTDGVSTPQSSTLNYPLKVKHIFLTFLQEFCAQQHPDVLMYWDKESLDKSNIMLLDSFAHNIERLIEQKPLVVFKRGPMYVAQGFMQENLLRRETRVDPTMRAKGETFYNDSIEYRTFMMSGQVDWHCISRQGMEAEQIATVVSFLHQTHQQVLRQKGLHAIKSIQIGEETLVTGDVETEAVMVPVTIAYDIQAHYEYWADGDPHRRTFLKGTIGDSDDMFLNTDP